MNATPNAVVRFGEFDLDLRSDELRRAGTRVPLPDQPLCVLKVLIEHAGTTVSREQLRMRLWPADTFVDFEHGLNAAVKRLRDALGDSAEHPRFVETSPKRGYRFIAPVKGASPPGTPISQPVPAHLTRWLVASIVGLCAILVAMLAAWNWTGRVTAVPTAEMPRGLTLSRITLDAGLQTQPAWSPDGQFIAYASDLKGNLDIWVQPVAGGEAVQVTRDAADDSAPAWSPDGQQLAFRSERHGGGIYVVNALGGGERVLANFGYRPRWSPDGKRLLVTSETGQQWEWTDKHAFVLTLDGSLPPTEILPTFFKGLVKSPSVVWHPDGERVSIWGEHKTLGPGFWTARLPDGAPVLSAGSVEPIKKSYWFWFFMDCVWATGADAVYFTGHGPQSINVMNVWRVAVEPATLRWVGEPQQLTNGPGPDAAAAPSRDGTRLAFASHHIEKRLWSFKLDTRGRLVGKGEPLIASPLLFDVSSDGRKLLLVPELARGKMQPPEIRERDLITGAERILSRTVGPWQALPQFPRWTPDATQVAYVRWCDRDAEGRPLKPCHSDMILIDARTGEDRVVPSTPGDRVFNVWDFSPDGQWVAVDSRSQETDPAPLVLYPTAPDKTHRAKMLGAPGSGLYALHARFSPNGRWIAVSASPEPPSSSALYVVPALGGTFVQITDGKAFDQKPRWASNGRILYFLSTRGSPGNIMNVWAIRFDRKRGRALGTPFPVTTYTGPSRSLPAVQFADFRIAQDRLIVPISETSGNIWMLEKPH